MLYPEDIEGKIGFDKVKAAVAAECISSLGVSFVEKVRFLDDLPAIARLAGQTEEFRQILLSQTGFPSTNYMDATMQLKKAKTENVFLTEEEFYELKLSLEAIFQCYVFLTQHEEQYPLLHKLTGLVNVDKGILNSINNKIDDRGLLRRDASPELQEITVKMQHEQARLRNVLDGILRQAKKQGYAAEDVSLTVRGGRMVIPVNAEHKRRIKGFVHDASASGKTIFLEPAEALEINNEIRDLEYREKREIARILTVLTDQLRPGVPRLLRAYQFLGMIDFIRAKARFALRIGASLPSLTDRQVIEIYNARHPLLWMAHKAVGKPVEPLYLTLNRDQRILVISGPNAGGKSVTLKTVALIQYMIQCGLLVPVDTHSVLGIFKNMFIDIGDEQSIENDLSTYSSHLSNMKHFTRLADNSSLFLIDEFGTGTEPQFGGAIAVAILTELNEVKAYGVVTTHYAKLKEFAERTPQVMNAAMRFDLERLEPLFQLEIGKPGSSFSLEIARKIGLPEKIIRRAKDNIGVDQVALDKLLQQLELEKKEYDERLLQVKKQKEELQAAVRKYHEHNSEISQQRKKLLNEAKAEARQLLSGANQQIEATIREIKEQNAGKHATREARKKLEKFKETIQPPAPPETQAHTVVKGEIRPGDMIRIRGQEAVGKVVRVKGKMAEINIGSLKSNIHLNRLEKISQKEGRRIQRETAPPSMTKGINLSERRSAFSSTLDLRGQRGGEALAMVDKFMDDAIILGYNELRIVHGKGDGILRKLVREHLRTFAQVRQVEDEHADRGGAGVTVVTMR